MRSIQLPPITEEVIQDVRDRIVEAVRPEQLWLFGSAARGETSEGSDLDLLVVMELPEGKSPYEQTVELHGLFSGMLVPMDIFVLQPAELEHWRDTPGHLAYTIVREGRRLHG